MGLHCFARPVDLLPKANARRAALPYAGVLRLEFDAGQAYEFLGFPPTAWDSFLRAESYGQHFNDSIRDRYTYRRVR